jgi:beta-xylosidase
MTLSYCNPIYPHDFADPFILRHDGEYYAFGTTAADSEGRPFPVLHSTDLIHWSRLGGALRPLTDPPARSYWAPEVIERDGRFYLYYSASTSSSDEHHRLHVAVSDHPAGPYIDRGLLLPEKVGFSIDASPFVDPVTGRAYLYFARDYETSEPHGTGLAVVELAGDMTTVTSEPSDVIRASGDWQVYEHGRNYKGRTWNRWYCVEGPSVLYRDGKYICFYSGGAWHGPSYGVGFATADHPLGPWKDDFAVHGPAVLKAIPGRVVGPGHNSTVLAPDGKTDLMVYHAWDPAHTARRMCIDPILWTKDGPRVDGPSDTPRPLPG